MKKSPVKSIQNPSLSHASAAVVIMLFCATFDVSAQSPVIKWWFDVLDSSFGQSTAGDIDGNGRLEVVFGCYRNDSCVYALNAENGSLLWKVNTRRPESDGCNDVAPALFDINNDGRLEVILPSSCNPTTYCFDGKTGNPIWQTLMPAGSDSPPTIADFDADGKFEILHGQFGGYVACLDAETGTQKWRLAIDNKSWVQTAPTILDANNDGALDFAVGTWNLDASGNSAYYVIDGRTRKALWSYPVGNYVYHGSAASDLDSDGLPELIVGAYNDTLYCFAAQDGDVKWTYYGKGGYIGAPATIADIDADGSCDVIFCSGYIIGALNNYGILKWEYKLAYNETSFRGVAIADINGDDCKDIIFGTSKGKLIALNGCDGSELWKIDLAAHSGIDGFALEHAPLIADFDGNDSLDAFIVGGSTNYPDVSKNRGRAYMLTVGKGKGPNWLMFQHDLRRQSSLCGMLPSSIISDDQKINRNLMENRTLGRSVIFRSFSDKRASITIFNILGEKITTIEAMPWRETNISLDNLASGAYYYLFRLSDNFISQGSFFLE